MIMEDVERVMSDHETSVEKVITEVMASSARKGLSQDDASWEAWKELVFGWDVPRFSAKKFIKRWLEENVYDD